MEPNKYAQFFAALNTFLSGKKTYLVTAVAIVYVFGGEQGWWKLSEPILYLLGFGGIAALRAGIQKVVPLFILALIPFGGLAQTFLYPNTNVPPANVTLAWDNPTNMTGVTGFRLYWGAGTRQYTNSLAVGLTNICTVTNLLRGATYYFGATSLAEGGLESDWSNEVNWAPPKRPLPPRMGSMQGNGVVKLSFSGGEANQTYAVEASPDLGRWEIAAKVPTDREGSASAEFPTQGGAAASFYRSAWRGTSTIPRITQAIEYPMITRTEAISPP